MKFMLLMINVLMFYYYTAASMVLSLYYCRLINALLQPVLKIIMSINIVDGFHLAATK